KEGNPVVAVLRLRFGENQVQIGDSPVGDEALPAIYDPFVPPPDRPGPNGAEIGAGPRLGKADGPEAGLLRIAQESEPPSLLLLRPEPVDQPGGQGGHAEGSGHPASEMMQEVRRLSTPPPRYSPGNR